MTAKSSVLQNNVFLTAKGLGFIGTKNELITALNNEFETAKFKIVKHKDCLEAIFDYVEPIRLDNGQIDMGIDYVDVIVSKYHWSAQ